MFNKPKNNGDGCLSVSTVEKAYSALSWIVRYCSEISNPPLMKENYLKKIIFKTLVPKGRSKRKRRDRSHTLEEIKELISILDSKANIRLKTMVNIVIDVGCRDEECLGLKWSDVNLQTGEIKYTEAITSRIQKKYSTKHSGVRSKELKSKHSYRNNYITPSFLDEYGDFRRRYGFKNIPLYDLRHFVSNLLLESGMSPKDVAQYMGNTPRTLLESYTEIRNETQIKMQSIINDKLRSNKQKSFDIEVIVHVLNSDERIDDIRAYELLDFVANKKITTDEAFWVIHNAKKLILQQYPMLVTFCNDDINIVKAKIDTYKTFNDGSIELSQDSNYYTPTIRI